MHFSSLFWVNSYDKTLHIASIEDGSNHRTIQLNDSVKGNHIFGLAISGNTAYVTSWSSDVPLVKINLEQHTSTAIVARMSQSAMFSAVFVSDTVQPINLGKITFEVWRTRRLLTVFKSCFELQWNRNNLKRSISLCNMSLKGAGK